MVDQEREAEVGAAAFAFLRSSGQYAPEVEVPAGADPQTRMIGFIGRDPSWRPDTPTS